MTDFAKVSEAGRDTGLNFKHISACCRGKRERHGGFQWRFEEPTMKHKLNDKQLRQGDVLLVEIPAMPQNAEQVDTNGGNIVIALGEVTGHAHQFMFRDAEMFHGGAAQVIKVLKNSPLKHEEHDPIKFKPGIYDRPLQVEHTDDQEPRIVAD